MLAHPHSELGCCVTMPVKQKLEGNTNFKGPKTNNDNQWYCSDNRHLENRVRWMPHLANGTIDFCRGTGGPRPGNQKATFSKGLAMARSGYWEGIFPNFGVWCSTWLEHVLPGVACAKLKLKFLDLPLIINICKYLKHTQYDWRWVGQQDYRHLMICLIPGPSTEKKCIIEPRRLHWWKRSSCSRAITSCVHWPGIWSIFKHVKSNIVG